MWRHGRSQTETHSQPINTLTALTHVKKSLGNTTQLRVHLLFSIFWNVQNLINKICTVKHPDWYVKQIDIYKKKKRSGPEWVHRTQIHLSGQTWSTEIIAESLFYLWCVFSLFLTAEAWSAAFSLRRKNRKWVMAGRYKMCVSDSYLLCVESCWNPEWWHLSWWVNEEEVYGGVCTGNVCLRVRSQSGSDTLRLS